VVVILDPVTEALARLLEGRKARPHQELLVDRLPEALDLAQRLRVMRPAAQMMHPPLGQFPLEGRLAPPVGVLPAVVGQHFLRRAVGAHAPPVDFQQVIRRLRTEDLQRRDVAGVVVDEADQVGVAARTQPLGWARRFRVEFEREDVALPELVRRAALEKARLGRIARRLLLRRSDQLRLVQRPADRLRTGRQMQDPPQRLHDAPHAKGGMGLLQLRDLGAD
jgi:hypothetical protein